MSASALERIDRWIGRRIFHPPIVALCQRTGMSQRAVARYGWMLATWTLLMRISFGSLGGWVISIFVIVVTIIETARAAINPEAPIPRLDLLRRIILISTVLDIVALAIATSQRGFPGFEWKYAWDLFALIAEYAKTIRTIPPLGKGGRRFSLPKFSTK
jgi:hypothetical protein